MITDNIPSEVWAKLVAHASFDGNIHENPNDSGARTRFYSQDAQKLRELQKIIKNCMNIDPYKEGPFDENRNRLVLRYSNTKFSRELMKLGAISGNKTTQKSRIPKWIRNGSKKEKIMYLAAMIEDEAERIKKYHIKSLVGLKIKQSKWIKYKANLRLFFRDIKNMFSSLGIKTGKITIDEKHKFKRKDGKKTITGWIRISLDKENQYRLVKTFSKYSPKIKVITDLTGQA